MSRGWWGSGASSGQLCCAGPASSCGPGPLGPSWGHLSLGRFAQGEQVLVLTASLALPLPARPLSSGSLSLTLQDSGSRVTYDLALESQGPCAE